MEEYEYHPCTYNKLITKKQKEESYMKLKAETKKALADSFSPELIAKVETCGSAQDVFDLLDKEKIELNEDQLDLIAGGAVQKDSPSQPLECTNNPYNPSGSC